MVEIRRPLCFIIMPFKAELNYFYLFIRSHLSEKFKIDIERADYKNLTKPVIEKIRDYIKASDFIIADITGRNANVMYELGYADALDKSVILISQDDIRDAPADIRHMEFIIYSLEKHVDFLGKLENALQHLLGGDIDKLYARASAVLIDFNKAMKASFKSNSKEGFQTLVFKSGQSMNDLVAFDDTAFAQFALPKIVEDTADFSMMETIMGYINKKSPPPKVEEGHHSSDAERFSVEDRVKIRHIAQTLEKNGIRQPEFQHELEQRLRQIGTPFIRLGVHPDFEAVFVHHPDKSISRIEF